MNNKEKLIIVLACTFTAVVSSGLAITQGNIKSETKDYKPIDITNQIDNHVKYRVIEKNSSNNSYIIQTEEETNDENLMQIIQDISSENNEKFNIYIKEENSIQVQVSKDDKQSVITRYFKVEDEVEGLPDDYKVLAIEPFEEKTRLSIEIPKSDDKSLVLGQVKSIGQKVKEDEISKGNNLGSLEIRAYYNEENHYWSYTSSNKDILMNNKVIPN